MIDWLLNILYNIGMFFGAIIAIIGVFAYFSAEAEYKNPDVANQRMLHELRKLNRLQREQIELEKTAQTQAQMRTLNVTQPELDALKPPGFFERMNAKLEGWNQRMDEQAAQKKQARLAKKSKAELSVPVSIQAPEPKIEENDSSYTSELMRSVVSAQFDLITQVEGLEKILNEHLPKAQSITNLTELEKKLPVDFWEKIAVFKIKFTAFDVLNLLAEIDALEKEYIQLKQQINVWLYPESVEKPHSRSTPPPLPPFS